MDEIVKNRRPIEELIPAERVALYRNDEPSRTLPAQTLGRDLAAISSEAAFMQMIERAACDPNIDIDKMQRLLEMKERAEARYSKLAFNDAFARMTGELPTISERGEIKVNSEVRSRYAKWEDINDVIKPILAAHGFSLRHHVTQTETRIIVTGLLSHKEGHTEETNVCLPLDTSGSKNNVQAVGSSISYGQRYTAKALLNLTSRYAPDADDDGAKAGIANTITDEQADELRNLALEAKADMPKFLEFFKAESIADIVRGDFDKAKRALLAKRSKASREASDNA